MKIGEILELGRMGYTKEEILKMDTTPPSETAETEQPAEVTETETEPATVPEKVPETEPVKPDAEIMKRLDSFEQRLTDLLKSIQAENVKRDSFGNAGPDIDAQADKAMASLITSGIERKE